MSSPTTNTPRTPIRIGILLFNGVEVLDFAGPFEVFSLTGKLYDGLVKVITIGETKQIHAHGLNVIVDELLDSNPLPQIDVLVVPGGDGTKIQCQNQILLDWINKLAPSLRHIISVCTGVRILGNAGLLDGLTITTHHKCYDAIRPMCPKSKICKCRRFVDNGKILTSAGISAGIDVSYHFIRKLYGSEVANTVAQHAEYDWKDEEYREKCDC